MRNARTIPPQTEQRDRDDWRLSARCIGHNPEIWFPHRPDDGASSDHAKAICGDCPKRVREACLRFALEAECTHGVFGGLTPSERDELRRRVS